MAFTKYNPIMHWVVKGISKRRGGPSDTSRDFESTDWRKVKQFVETFAMNVDRALVATGGPTVA